MDRELDKENNNISLELKEWHRGFYF
jgi:hypothetical protein